jgi:hypothetical protein
MMWQTRRMAGSYVNLLRSSAGADQFPSLFLFCGFVMRNEY